MAVFMGRVRANVELTPSKWVALRNYDARNGTFSSQLA